LYKGGDAHIGRGGGRACTARLRLRGEKNIRQGGESAKRLTIIGEKNGVGLSGIIPRSGGAGGDETGEGYWASSISTRQRNPARGGKKKLPPVSGGRKTFNTPQALSSGFMEKYTVEKKEKKGLWGGCQEKGKLKNTFEQWLQKEKMVAEPGTEKNKNNSVPETVSPPGG